MSKGSRNDSRKRSPKVQHVDVKAIKFEGMSAIGWLILAIVVVAIALLVFVIIRRRRRGGGVIATRGER